MSQEIVRAAIEKAGGTAVLALELGMSAEGVRLWAARALPDDRVLWLAGRTGWEFTPHQLAPHLYPHHDDGLPPARRSRRTAAA